MPGWNIHFEVGERVAEKMKLSPEEKEEFLLGCILPDINNGYINKVKVKKMHRKTHFSSRGRSALDFFEKYQSEIENRKFVFLGYLLHLYTDEWFNNDFYAAISGTEMENLSREKKLDIKHNDFWIYDTKFRGKKLEIKNLASVIKKANEIEEVDINEDDVREVQRVFRSDEFVKAMKGKKYVFYTEEKLDEKMREMVDEFCRKFLN